MDFEFLKSIITRGKIQLKKTKGKQICLDYLQLKNIRGTFCFDYTILLRQQISNYSTQKNYISVFKKNCNIFIYNVSHLILPGEKGNSYFFFTNLPTLSTIKKYKNHFPFRSHYIVCETKYMCLIFI